MGLRSLLSIVSMVALGLPLTVKAALYSCMIKKTHPANKVDKFLEGIPFERGSSIMKRILIVDDHEMARQALKLFLEHLGYACEEAEHGIGALAWLKQGQNVDLIVSDNQMPVMTGLEFLLQVRANPHFGSIPFILYSGNITDELQRQAHQAGAIAVLNKPYNFSDIVAVVTKALETP